MKALFVGLGYIGLPSATIVAKKGIEVIGVDTNADLVAQINSENFQTSEYQLQDMLAEVVRNKKLIAKTTPEEADVFFIVVPTPINQENKPDISIVKEAIESIIPFLKSGDLIIIESTVSQSTTSSMADLIFNKRPDLNDSVFISYCPERVLPGNIIDELENNDRVVGGINKESASRAKEFYSKFVKGSIHETDSRTAELCKLTENAYRDVQIAFANELSIIANKSNVDIWELIDLANKHPRINILNPGCGVGGHCIAVDPWFLISDFPEHTQLILTARERNLDKTKWCLNQIKYEIELFRSKHDRYPIIACMGIAYKENSDDTRESPAKFIANELTLNSQCEVLTCEPNLTQDDILELSNLDDVSKKADLILWLVAHDEFVDFNQSAEIKEIDFCGLRLKSK